MKLPTPESASEHTSNVTITNFSPSEGAVAYTRYVRSGIDPEQRVVLLHGFTQNSRSFVRIAAKIAAEHRADVICVDLPGHGASGLVEAALEASVDLFGAFGTQSIWVGYSLGARHLLSMCLANPKKEWNVVLSGVNPGIENHVERKIRYQADLALAERLKKIDGDAEQFEAFLKEWMAQPIFQPRNFQPDDLKIRLTNGPSHLARSLELSSLGAQPNYWPLLNTLRGTFTFINGGTDRKYLEITRRIASSMDHTAQTRRIVLEKMGHSSIFDRQDFLIAEVGKLLNHL